MKGQRREHAVGDVFVTVAHEKPRSAHPLERHCCLDAARGGYADENDRVIPERVEPCGWFALANFEHLQCELDETPAGRPPLVPYPKNAKA
ncbi:MAG: hypothetical protein HOV92_35430 [Streptomyces sp.]|nr:hypothetical protein [Streptomyces sp.]